MCVKFIRPITKVRECANGRQVPYTVQRLRVIQIYDRLAMNDSQTNKISIRTPYKEKSIILAVIVEP